MKAREAEQYYIDILVSYGQEEEGYSTLNWRDEQELSAEFIEYIYSDAFLEMLNSEVQKWYEELISHIKTSGAYNVFKERTEGFLARESIFESIVQINNYIIEVYAYQKEHSKKIEHLKERATLLKEGSGSCEDELDGLNKVHKRIKQLNISYRSLQKQYQEICHIKRTLGYAIKRPLYYFGILEEKNKEEILLNQLQVLEQKLNSVEQTRYELQQRYDMIEVAITKLQKELLTSQAIGELTNIQQQLPLTNEAIFKQIGRPIMRQIFHECGMEMPKGAYCFKVYVEACILKAVKSKREMSNE